MRTSCAAAFFLGASFSWVLAAEKPTTATATCVTQECHAAYKTQKYVHGPVAHDVCKFCHTSRDAATHTFTLFREGWELCVYCHRDQAFRGNLHRPVANGDCGACHDPHASDSPFLVRAATTADLCAKCHERKHVSGSSLHAPVKAGECTLCHDPHASEHERLFPVETKALCDLCHQTIRDRLAQFEYVHTPVAEKSCTECHDAHGSNEKGCLTKGIPDFCYRCHESVRMRVESVRYRHDAVSEKGGCVVCHTPHASTERNILKCDPLTLCVACHDREMTTASGDRIADFAAEIENKSSLHGPVAHGQCEGCHRSHGSDHFRLLVEEYPASFYAPFDVKNYRLCFTCHSEGTVLARETTTITDFRNGASNLHYVHVNKNPKGRTCRACHATHASNLATHIRESVPFQEWEIPIRFEKSASGGACRSGCHEPRTYDRVAPVKYASPPEPVGSPPPSRTSEPRNDKPGESRNGAK